MHHCPSCSLPELLDRPVLHPLLGLPIQPHHPLNLARREWVLTQVEVPEQPAIIGIEHGEQQGQQSTLLVGGISRSGEAGGDAVREVGLGDRAI
jgi:hypothetical protein